MREENNILELVDDYVNGFMPEEDISAFEERMASDPDLAEMVEQYRFTNEAIHFANLAEIKNTVAGDIKKIKYKSGPGWNYKYLLSGLAILSGAALIGYFATAPEQVSEEITGRKKDTVATLEMPKKVAHSIEEKSIDKNTSVNITTEESSASKNRLPDTINQKNTTVDTKTPVEPKTTKTSTENPEKKIPEISLISKNRDPGIADTNTNASIQKETPENKVHCDKIFEINTKAACKGNSNGALFISTEGKESYLVKIESLNIENELASIYDIPAGKYDLTIEYREVCSYKEKINVPEKWCPMNQSFSFNPGYGEKWELKYSDGDRGTYTIFDKFGKEVYRGEFGNGSNTWEGTNQQGNILPIGTYMTIISYSDGRKEKVELTIVR